MVGAFRAFGEDVRSGRFPSGEHTHEIADEEWEAFDPLRSEAPASARDK